jgi:hypothetical protein
VATLIAAAIWTILLSALAHGLSAIPLLAWYARSGGGVSGAIQWSVTGSLKGESVHTLAATCR